MSDILNKKIRQTFLDTDPKIILDELSYYGQEDYETGQERVYLAIVKLSEGSLDKLKHNVVTAKEDWRDVIAWAEYNREFMLEFTIGLSDPNKEELLEAARKEDREEYLAWLNS